MNQYVNTITTGNCIDYLSELENNSVHCFLSDIPYGISFSEWDILHNNTNSALLGKSPAQFGKSGFKTRGKPLIGWSNSDKNIPKEYQEWCYSWSKLLYPKMKNGSSLFIFGARRLLHRAIIAFEDSGFIIKDVIAWKKPIAHRRAQKISNILEKKNSNYIEKWKDWRIGNLPPIWEPIAWLFKPYDKTLTDNVIENELGAINTGEVNITNFIECWFDKHEPRLHEAQKPIKLLELLIKLTTREGQIILDPFIGSGSTAIACKNTKRNYIGFEINENYVSIAKERISNESSQG